MEIESLILLGMFVGIVHLALVGYLVLSFVLAILYSNDSDKD